MSNVIPAVESVFALSLYFRKFLIYSHTREISEWHACDSHVLQYSQAIQLLWVQRVHLKGTRTNLSIPFQWYYSLSSKLFQLFSHFLHLCLLFQKLCFLSKWCHFHQVLFFQPLEFRIHLWRKKIKSKRLNCIQFMENERLAKKGSLLYTNCASHTTREYSTFFAWRFKWLRSISTTPSPRTTSKSTANYPPPSHPCITMSFLDICWHPLILLGPVVQRPISANPGLNFNLGFFLSLFKSLFGTIFLLLFRAANYQLVDKNNWCGFSLKAFRSEIKFHTNPGLS